MTQAGRECAALVFMLTILVLVAFCAGRLARKKPEGCISCSTMDAAPIRVVSCEAKPGPRCPAGPILWSDVFKSPKRGGFTVNIPEGRWRVDWESNDHGAGFQCSRCGAAGIVGCDPCVHAAGFIAHTIDLIREERARWDALPWYKRAAWTIKAKVRGWVGLETELPWVVKYPI